MENILREYVVNEFNNQNKKNLAIFSQIEVFSCNFNGQTNINLLCGESIGSSANGGATFGTVLNEIVPNVEPNWYITDYTSISMKIKMREIMK